jgi:hypothetical protein
MLRFRKMSQDKEASPIRLVPLLNVGKGLDDSVDLGRLLTLCIEGSVRGYVSVPPGQVVVVYRQVQKQQKRSLFGPETTIIGSKRSPAIVREIRQVALDVAELQSIRDVGSTTVEGFVNGGLAAGKTGLFPLPFEYAVIQKDSPNRLGASVGGLLFPEPLLEGLVYPIALKIVVEDVLISDGDAKTLRNSIDNAFEFEDKYGHRNSAPGVFLVYCAAKGPYDLKSIMDLLLGKRGNGLFNIPIAKSITRIIKTDVRKNANAGMATEKIKDNETGRDYTDPALSIRTSLLLLATDCWIHDRLLWEEQKKRLKVVENDFAELMDDPKLVGEERDKVLSKKAKLDFGIREEFAKKFYMPDGSLFKYLRKLGFSVNLAGQLERVITGEKPAGLHAATKRAVAEKQRQ